MLFLEPHELRTACRTGTFTGPTAGHCLGYAQANLVVLPGRYAADFLAFCRLNPAPCPVLEVTEPGDYQPRQLAPNADLRTDLPRYRVFDEGRPVDRPTDLLAHWRDDLIAILIGCSFTFDAALQEARLPVRHIEQNRNVPMYRTNIDCSPAGPFHGPLVVSMRPMPPQDAEKAARITAALPDMHGRPIHNGDPAAIGIADLARPDYGDPVDIRPGEIPVFWACGVTPMEAITRARPELAITHEPGHMFVTDLPLTRFTTPLP